MASKKGLGKGLDALIKNNPGASEEVLISQGLGLHSVQVVKGGRPANVPACIEVDAEGGLWCDVNLLKPNPKQPRMDFNPRQLEELCDSIKQVGILEPIIIEPVEGKENTFYIIAGERRSRAAKMAGVDKVPVQLRKFDEQQKLEYALIENIQRADLNPIEEATAYYNLIQMGDLSQDEVAKRVGKNRSTVANALRLLKLPDDIQKSLAAGQISSGHARALLMVKNDADMRILYGKIVGSGLSVREAEALADTYNNGGRAAAKKPASKKTRKDPDIALFEQELRNLFGVKDVNFKGDTTKGSLEIKFSSKADFDRIYNVLLGDK